MSAVSRVSLAARAFTLAATIAVASLLGVGVLRGAVLVIVTAAWAQVFSATGHITESWLAVLEGAATAVLAAATWPANDAVTPYLLVPCLIGGLAAGLTGVIRVIVTEAIVASIAWWLLVDHVDRGTVAHVLTWLFAGLGLGILGLVYRRTLTATEADSTYRDALNLIKQLHALSGRLTSGLDAVGLAEQVMATVAGRLSVAHSVVMIRSDAGQLIPLRFSGGADVESLLDSSDCIDAAWASGRSVVRGHRLAVPLCPDSETIAVVLADCVPPPDSRSIEALREELAPKAVQLYAALLFGDVRDAATSDERQRLAREVHDGVAQDVASLGYIIDNLLESGVDADQLIQLGLLREEVTRVVAELRHSVFDLRNEVGAGQGLGQSISSFARHIGSHSDMTVHVTLDEASVRLRPEVEAELLRVAQEAINNARKHSGARNLWVTCEVRPPRAAIEVLDDGNGLGQGREDSHGLRIMRERAERVGAELSIEPASPTGSGTRVSLRLHAGTNSVSDDEGMVRA